MNLKYKNEIKQLTRTQINEKTIQKTKLEEEKYKNSYTGSRRGNKEFIDSRFARDNKKEKREEFPYSFHGSIYSKPSSKHSKKSKGSMLSKKEKNKTLQPPTQQNLKNTPKNSSSFYKSNSCSSEEEEEISGSELESRAQLYAKTEGKYSDSVESDSSFSNSEQEDYLHSKNSSIQTKSKFKHSATHKKAPILKKRTQVEEITVKSKEGPRIVNDFSGFFKEQMEPHSNIRYKPTKSRSEIKRPSKTAIPEITFTNVDSHFHKREREKQKERNRKKEREKHPQEPEEEQEGIKRIITSPLPEIKAQGKLTSKRTFKTSKSLNKRFSAAHLTAPSNVVNKIGKAFMPSAFQDLQPRNKYQQRNTIFATMYSIKEKQNQIEKHKNHK